MFESNTLATISEGPESSTTQSNSQLLAESIHCPSFLFDETTVGSTTIPLPDSTHITPTPTPISTPVKSSIQSSTQSSVQPSTQPASPKKEQSDIKMDNPIPVYLILFLFPQGC